jgi:hypothetical protein
MKKITQYLQFILWSISIITITALLFVALPIIFLWEKFVTHNGRDTVTSDASGELCYS